MLYVPPGLDRNMPVYIPSKSKSVADSLFLSRNAALIKADTHQRASFPSLNVCLCKQK